MASAEFPIPQPSVTVTLQIPAKQRAEFEQLLQDFFSGKVRALALAFDFDAHDYRGAAQALMHALSPYTRGNRILEDDKRDPAAALADAEAMHALHISPMPALRAWLSTIEPA